MTTTSDAPADTRMMAIVHAALKRDLVRSRDVLSADPAPRGAQRKALGQHVLWLMAFLHAHHTSEDEGLWPLVRRRNPGAAELLDSLEADHARIAPAADQVVAAARTYATTTAGAPGVELVQELDRLVAVLFPHLDREVADAMPVVSASITAGEWDAIEQDYNIRPKSLRQLAIEAHWVLDGIDPEGYNVVVHKVPAVPRFVILHGFGGVYRRQARARWTPVESSAAAAVR